jgi:hypothetical protein
MELALKTANILFKNWRMLEIWDYTYALYK